MNAAIPRQEPLRQLAQARVAICGFAFIYGLARVSHLWEVGASPVSRWRPVLFLAWSGEPWPSLAYGLLILGTLVLAFLSAVAWRYRVVAPLFALCLALLMSYRNSWGMVFHTENLLVLHAMIMAFAPADRFFVRAREARPAEPYEERWARSILGALMVCTLLSYFVAGWAKLDRCGWEWFSGETIRIQVAFDNLRKESLGSFYSPLGLWMSKQGWMWGPLATLTAVVELGAPLALLHRRLILIWVMLAWVLHFGIALSMAIIFPYHLSLVAYFGCFPVLDLLWHRVRKGDERVSDRR